MKIKPRPATLPPTTLESSPQCIVPDGAELTPRWQAALRDCIALAAELEARRAAKHEPHDEGAA